MRFDIPVSQDQPAHGTAPNERNVVGEGVDEVDFLPVLKRGIRPFLSPALRPKSACR